jgi:hypothetical protein
MGARTLQERKAVPQGLKPSAAPAFTARLKPCHWSFSLQSQRARRRTVGSIFCNVLQLDPCQAVPAPDFSPGKRAFKPARTLYLANDGLQPW